VNQAPSWRIVVRGQSGEGGAVAAVVRAESLASDWSGFPGGEWDAGIAGDREEKGSQQCLLGEGGIAPGGGKRANLT